MSDISLCKERNIINAAAAGCSIELLCCTHLTINLSKTDIVVLRTRHSECINFVLDGSSVKRTDSYRYLRFHFHATKIVSYGAGESVSAARKAVHAMPRRCAELHVKAPALQCKLVDSLVLPILCYGREVWAVDPGASEKAEVLHRQFLKHLLHRNSTANWPQQI